MRRSGFPVRVADGDRMGTVLGPRRLAAGIAALAGAAQRESGAGGAGGMADLCAAGGTGELRPAVVRGRHRRAAGHADCPGGLCGAGEPVADGAVLAQPWADGAGRQQRATVDLRGCGGADLRHGGGGQHVGTAAAGRDARRMAPQLRRHRRLRSAPPQRGRRRRRRDGRRERPIGRLCRERFLSRSPRQDALRPRRRDVWPCPQAPEEVRADDPAQLE